MDRRIEQMRRDPVKYVEKARMEASGGTTTSSSDRRTVNDTRSSSKR